MEQETISAIRDAITSVEKRTLHLCKRSKSGEIEDEIRITRPTSDHDILVHANPFGNIATWNILNPDSPVSPGFLPADRQGFYVLCNDKEKEQHLEDVAFAIGRLFAAGVDAMALQEIPAPGTQNFTHFVRSLNNASYRFGVEFDMPAFLGSLYRTKKPNSNDYNKFSLGLLLKVNSKFAYLSSAPKYKGRAVIYNLLVKDSSEKLHVVNTHGDYVSSTELCNNIKNDLASMINPIILGDMNIPLSNAQAMEQIAQINGYCVIPTTNRTDTEDKYRTLDCILSNMKPSITLVNGNLKNYAKECVS